MCGNVAPGFQNKHLISPDSDKPSKNNMHDTGGLGKKKHDIEILLPPEKKKGRAFCWGAFRVDRKNQVFFVRQKNTPTQTNSERQLFVSYLKF